MKKYHGITFILAPAGGFVPYIAYRILLTMVSEENKARQLITLADQNSRYHACWIPSSGSTTTWPCPPPGGAAQPARDRRAHPRALWQRLPLRTTHCGRLHGQPVRATPLQAITRQAIDRANAENSSPGLPDTTRPERHRLLVMPAGPPRGRCSHAMTSVRSISPPHHSKPDRLIGPALAAPPVNSAAGLLAQHSPP